MMGGKLCVGGNGVGYTEATGWMDGCVMLHPTTISFSGNAIPGALQRQRSTPKSKKRKL